MLRKSKTKVNLFTQITTVYIYLMLTVFLFFCGNRGYQGIMAAKFSVFCILCGGYIAVMALAALESLIVGAVKFRSPLTVLKTCGWTRRLVILYLLLTWISALLSRYFPETVLGISRMEGALTITVYGVCFLLVSVYGKVSEGMLWVLGIAALVFSAVCLLQIAGFNPLSLFPEGVGYADRYIAYSGEYLGTTGNADLTAAFFCLVIPIMWVLLVRLREKRRFFLLIPLAASLATVLCMDVMAGLMGVFAGGLLTVPVVAPISKRKKKILWCAMIAAGILAAAAVFFVDFGSGFLHQLHELLHGRADRSFGSGRIQIWSEVIQRIPEQILFGSGPDTMIRAGLQGFSKVKEDLGTVVVAKIDAAHSEYLNILFHQGILALAAYLGVLISLAHKWIRNSGADAVTAALGAAACAYCIQALSGISMFIVAPLFWLILGLLERRSSVKFVGGHKK